MALKNLFGRGIGFGGPEFIPTHGYSISNEPAIVIAGPMRDLSPRFVMDDLTPDFAMRDLTPRFPMSVQEYE